MGATDRIGREPAPAGSPPGGAITGFDGLRAVAALTVLSYHVGLWSGFAPGGAVAPVLWELKGGVAIFFVISGTLLYLPYARSILAGAPLPDWRRYGRRRVVRIVPAYWLALTVVAIGPFHASVFGSDAWRYYGLSQIYDPQTLFGGLQVAWSLCVEVTFYLFLPVFAWWAARLAASRANARAGHANPGAATVQVALIAAGALGSVLLRGLLAGSLTAPTPGASAAVSLPGLFDWFAIGMLLAVLRAQLEAGRPALGPLGALARRPGCCLALALAAFAAAVPTQHRDLFLPWYGLVTHLALGAGAGLMVLSVIVPRARTERPWPVRLLGHPVLAWVGTVSYGIYLWHFPVLELIGPHLLANTASHPLGAVALTWLGVLGGAVMLAAASWYLVERPLQRRFGRRAEGADRRHGRGHMPEIGAPVHSTIDPLNSPGVAADHLA
jgi:peptidoglycan/LPS O-acetylase OafA/YrhL